VTGVGDALIFPFFDADKDNIVVITNESNLWVQAHVRLRTGSQSVEGRDFPLILSPGDMAVFSVTRKGYADELWRIDTELDANNFKYVRINTNYPAAGENLSLYEFAQATPLKNEFNHLNPNDGTWTEDQMTIDKKYGYIEVFGEAVFDQGLDKAALLLPEGSTNAVRYIETAGNTLSDVPNVLSGKIYIMEAMNGTGVAYNAIALADFRTNSAAGTHRVENYALDTGVILTSENSNINDAAGDDYTYIFENDRARATVGGDYEAMVSANNSWGPTLADGDDYLADTLDTIFGTRTSVREVEQAFRQVSVRGHYFNTPGSFETRLVVMFPTKHHVVVNPTTYATAVNFQDWMSKYYTEAKNLKPQYSAEIWDIDESMIMADPVAPPFEISPRPVTPPPVVEVLELPNELNVFAPTGSAVPFSAGRLVLSAFVDGGLGRYLEISGTLPVIAMSYIDMGGAIGYMTETQY
jgi:hypothetical protein